jgi:hypothetical protein
MLWKWHIVIFEIALVCELIISPYFWLLLWPSVYNSGRSTLFIWTQSLVHSVPLIILLTDFIILNWVPILLRHYCAVFFVTISYMIVNVTVTKVQGHAVYPGMTWDSLAGFVLPLVVAVASYGLFWVMTKCSNVKDKKF